jgi:hypothetical protein
MLLYMSSPLPENPPRGIDTVDLGIELWSEDHMTLLGWYATGWAESLIIDQHASAANPGSSTILDVTRRPGWAEREGRRITGCVLSTQVSEDGREYPWAMRIEFENAPEVVVALGEVLNDEPCYQPTSLLAFFDENAARRYEISCSTTPAWGEASTKL